MIIRKFALSPAPCPKKGKKLIFMQDGATADRAMFFLEEKGITSLNWPGNWSDLNPIEHVWWHMARRVRARGLPSSKQVYWEWLQEEWHATPASNIKRLYRSLPSRIQEVLANRGGCNHYREFSFDSPCHNSPLLFFPPSPNYLVLTQYCVHYPA